MTITYIQNHISLTNKLLLQCFSESEFEMMKMSHEIT